jgi:hypothetical protein
MAAISVSDNALIVCGVDRAFWNTWRIFSMGSIITAKEKRVNLPGPTFSSILAVCLAFLHVIEWGASDNLRLTASLDSKEVP